MLDLKSLIPFRHKSHEVAKGGDYPRDPFYAFRQEMDHLIDNFFNGGSLAREGMGWGTAMPTLDVTDGDKELTITAELPGMTEADVDLKVSGDLLTIEGEKTEESEKKEGETTYSERRYGKFSRAIRLPFEVKDEKIDATFDKGVLTVNLEKPVEQQQAAKKIDIKTV